MIIAHRGESYLAPENSLSAINLAWEKGAEAVEIDIHLTADREIVVIHDKHTGRIGKLKYLIAKSSLQKLKSVDIGSKKAPEYAGESIPTLPEVIKTMPRDRKLIIEIKCGKEIIVPLTEILQKSGLKNDQFEIISFDLNTLSLAKKAMPQYNMLWLLNLDYYWSHWLLRTNPANIIKKVIRNKLNGVNVWAGKALDKTFVDAFKKEGLLIYAWTVNETAKAETLLRIEVDAITTDRAAWLREQLAKIRS
jgi:glycerophosphoryl diester phosphodiesterase